MPDIYRQAKHVIVWPGRVEYRSLSIPFEEAEQEGFHFQGDTDGSIDLSQNPDVEKFVTHITAKKLFHNPILRNYFDRLWIFQELVLSKNTYIILSGRMERWDGFAQLIINWWDRQEKRIDNDEFKKGLKTSMLTIQHDHMPGVEENAIPPQFVRLVKLSIQHSHKRLSLDELVATSGESACSEPRDHLYGLLGLIENGRGFPVDYSQSKECILFDALEYFVPKVVPDFRRSFVDAYTNLSTLFGTDVGPLCKPCAIEGRPDHNTENHGRESFQITLTSRTDLPVEFLLTPVRRVACYNIGPHRLKMYHTDFGYCQACRTGIFNFCGMWPAVSIAYSRQTPTRLWVTVSKAKISTRHRIADKLQDVGRILKSGQKEQGGGGSIRIRYGNNMPTIASLHPPAFPSRSREDGDHIEQA